MGNFMGGSAWAMAQQIGEGYILVSERTYKRLERGELDKLAFEMEKLLREVRGEQVPLDDVQAIQQKNRKVSRLMGALSQLRQYLQQRLRVARARHQHEGRAPVRPPSLRGAVGSGRPVPPASPGRQLRRHRATRPSPASPSPSSRRPELRQRRNGHHEAAAAEHRRVVGRPPRPDRRSAPPASLVPLPSASKAIVPWLDTVCPAAPADRGGDGDRHRAAVPAIEPFQVTVLVPTLPTAVPLVALALTR